MSMEDENVLREMRLLKRNANKAIVKVCRKSKSDTVTIQEMDELKDEVEPLIKLLDDYVTAHFELLESKESDHDEEMEEWENEAEVTHIMWEHCLNLWRHQLAVLDRADETVEEATDARGGDLWGRR